MKNTIRVLLLCVICMVGGLQEKLYAQTYQLDIYQIKVSVGHATLVVVSDMDETPRRVVSSNLIDTGDDEHDAEIIKDVIEEVADDILDNIFITHGDKDHLGGTEKLSEYIADGTLYCRRCGTGDPNAVDIIYALHNPDIASRHDINMPTIFYQDNLYYEDQLDDGTNRDFVDFWDKAFTTEAPTDVFMNRFVWQAGDVVDLTTNTHYANGTEYTRYPGDIILKTYAMACHIPGINKVVLDGCERDNITAVEKNNRSSVMTIEWGDFKFLIQGDMEASTTKNPAATIGHTKSSVNEWAQTTDQYQTFRDPGGQSARSIYPNDPDLTPYYTPGLIRIDGNSFDELAADYHSQGVERVRFRSESSLFPSDPQRRGGGLHALNMYFEYREPVAIPDSGRYQLFNEAIENVCVALVPHHGALTSNLWYRTGINVYGTPRRSSFGGRHFHPRIQNIVAAQTQTGAGLNFYTYAEHPNKNQAALLSDIQAEVPGATHHVLHRDNDTFWNFRVEENNKSLVKVYKGSTYITPTATTMEYGSGINNGPGFNCNY